MKPGPKQRRSRDYRVGGLADGLGISGRTIKRRLDEYPGLADALRATKHGKEWRFDYPTTAVEYDFYLAQAKAALDKALAGRLTRQQKRTALESEEYIQDHYPGYSQKVRASFVETLKKAPNADARRQAQCHLERFDECRSWLEAFVRPLVKQKQTAERKDREQLGAEFDQYFGFGDAKREQDIDRLRVALRNKRARMEKIKETDEDFGYFRDPDFDQWKADAEAIPGTARKIASQFLCPVRDAIKHWGEHLERLNEVNRRHNEQEIAELRRLATLAPQVEQVLRETDVSQGARSLRVSGKFIQRHVQLWQVGSPSQIQAEFNRIKELWPEAKDWPDPKDHKLAKLWERRTLHEAAYELVRDDKPIKVENLRQLLYRDEEHERQCENHQIRCEEEEKLAGVPHIWFGQPHLARPPGHAHKPHQRPSGLFGERGISRREFFQRYTKKDVRSAQDAALKSAASDINRGSNPEGEQPVIEPEILEAMGHLDYRLKPADTQELKQAIDQTWANGHRERIKQQKPEIQEWFASLKTPEDRKLALEALNNPFSDEKPRRTLRRKPKNE